MSNAFCVVTDRGFERLTSAPHPDIVTEIEEGGTLFNAIGDNGPLNSEQFFMYGGQIIKAIYVSTSSLPRA